MPYNHDDYFQIECVDCGNIIWLPLDLTLGEIHDNPELEMCGDCIDYQNGVNYENEQQS